MLYNILSPVAYAIDANSFKDAIKNYIILNYEMKINNLIITDQTNHMDARIKYYENDIRNRVGIDMYPLGYNQMLQYQLPNSSASISASISGYNPYSILPPMPMSPVNNFIPNVVIYPA
jgi:hypothetical protein